MSTNGPARRIAAEGTNLSRRKFTRTGITLALGSLLGETFCIPLASAAGESISDGVVKIGLLLDMSSLYADVTGAGSLQAARMAGGFWRPGAWQAH